MSALGKWSIDMARPAAERVRALFEGTYERWEIAGSIRRNKQLVGDIEHVILPRFVEKDVEIKAPPAPVIEDASGGLFSGMAVRSPKLPPVVVKQTVNLVMERADELLAAGVISKALYPDGKPRWGPKTRGLMDGPGAPEGVKPGGWDDPRWHHELFTCSDEAGWVPLLVIKTGSAEFVEWLVTRLRDRGVFRQQEGYVRYQGGVSAGEIRVVHSEEEYFGLCGVAYMEPSLRTLARGVLQRWMRPEGEK